MRHLKCDEGKPTCLRCSKAKIECRGYEVLQVFVDERSKTIQRSGRRAPCKVKAASAPPAISWRSESPNATAPVPSPTPPSEMISRPLSPPASPTRPLLASREELYVTFLVDRLSGAGWGKNIHAIIVEEVWYRAILHTDSEPSTIDFAASALSAAFFGKLQFQPKVTALAMSRYGRALSMLKNDLACGHWANSFTDTLASAMCLILFETVMFTNSEGWKGHASGISRLIEARGPASFQDTKAQKMLRGNRLPIIMAALLDRRPCFLDSEDWRTVPWMQNTRTKLSGDSLFEIFASVPRIVAEMESLEDRPDADATQLYGAIVASMQELYRWRWDWERENPNVAVEVPSTLEPQSLFSTQLHFSSVVYGHLISMYDATLLMFTQLLKRICGPAVDFQRTLPKAMDLPSRSNPMRIPGLDPIDARATAREICKIIKFRMESVVTSAVAFGIFVPARMAWAILRDCPEEGEWITRVGHILEQRSGLEFSKLVLWSRRFPEKNLAIRLAIMGKGSDDPIYAQREKESLKRFQSVTNSNRANSIY